MLGLPLCVWGNWSGTVPVSVIVAQEESTRRATVHSCKLQGVNYLSTMGRGQSLFEVLHEEGRGALVDVLE